MAWGRRGLSTPLCRKAFVTGASESRYKRPVEMRTGSKECGDPGRALKGPGIFCRPNRTFSD